MLHPKTGMLSTITNLHLTKQIPNVFFVPISVNYEKTIEGDLYSNELLGENKIKENFKNLLKSSSKFLGGSVNFGTISVVIRKAIDLQEFTNTYAKEMMPIEQARRDSNLNNNGTTNVNGPNFGVPFTNSVKTNPTAINVAATTALDSSSSSSSIVIPDMFRKHFNQTLAYHIIYEMQLGTEIMPTHLVSTLMLMYRQGITKQQLVTKVDWLRREVLRRGGETNNFATNDRTDVVTKAVGFLSNVIVQRRSEVYEPAINSRNEYRNMLVLGHYRNKIVHLFFKEGIVACALYALMDKQEQAAAGRSNTNNNNLTSAASSSSAAAAAATPTSQVGIARAPLLTEVRFLFNLLQREFIYTSQIPDRIDSDKVSEQVLDDMLRSGIFKSSTGSDGSELIEVASTGETHFSFLCALIWPFIDSYYASAMVLFSLQPNKKMEETQLLQRTQWLATTLYHESMLCFYESCSMDTLRNAFDVYQKWSIIKYEKLRSKSTAGPSFGPPQSSANNVKTNVSLMPPYQQEEAALQQLISKINFLRKPPPVKRNPLRRNLIADLPMMARL